MVSNNRLHGLIAAALLAGSGVAAALDPQLPVLVSVRWDTGEPSYGVCALPRFSRNNRFLAFSCHADDLTPNDNNSHSDSFLLDRQTDTIERLSVSSSGQEMPYDSIGGIPADSGLLVAFRGTGPLHPDYGPPPPLDVGHSAVYLRRRATNETDLITRDALGRALTAGASFYDADFSRHEMLIDYRGDIRVDPHDDPQIVHQLWVKNWLSGAVELISAPLNGDLSGGGGYQGSFSSTGRYVVFKSRAGGELGPPARLGDENLYLRDRMTGTIERLTYPWANGEFQAPLTTGPTPPRVSTNGRFVVFSSASQELHPDTTTVGGTRVYLLDRQTGQLEHLSVTPGYSSYNIWVDISDDGRYVAWTSRNFSFQGPPNPTTDMRAIWVLDRQTGQRVNVAESLGPLYLDNPTYMDLSPDGSMIAFTWRIADEADPLFGWDLLYTAQLHGTPPPTETQPVPIGSLAAWGALGFGLALLAWRRLHASSPRL